jgi:hypothetical protein
MPNDLPKLNVKHINKILAHIREDVKRLHMPRWGVKKQSQAAKVSGLRVARFPSCGTVACFAGWSLLLATPRKEWKSLFTSIGSLDIDAVKEVRRLGLSPGESSLFASCDGTAKEQLTIVEDRLRAIVRERVLLGDNSAKEIKV